MIAGISLFVGISGLYKWLVPGFLESGLYIVPPIISIPVNVAIIVVGLCLLAKNKKESEEMILL
jgi:hypothetical protein